MQNVDWFGLWSDLWQVLDSPLFIAILGGFLATWLAARWQKKSLIFSLRVEMLKKLMDADGEWYNSLFSERWNDERFVVPLAGEIAKVTNMVQALFPYEDVRTVRKSYLAVVNARTKVVGTTDKTKADELAMVSGDRFREFLETLFKRLGVPT